MKKKLAVIVSLIMVLTSMVPVNVVAIAEEMDAAFESEEMKNEDVNQPETDNKEINSNDLSEENETVLETETDIETETDLETEATSEELEESSLENETETNEVPLVRLLNASEIRTSGYWKYQIDGGTATVVGYTGSSSSITIPDSLGGYTVTKIGSEALENNNMTSLTIPAKITSIGYGAFQNCTKLSVINYNAKNCAAIDYSYDVFAKAGASASSLTVYIGNTVEKIPNNLFRSYYDENYARVTRIVLSDSVQKIGDSAFRNCKDLTTISWGTGLLEIGEAAFANAESLSSVSLPAKLTTIKTQAFKNSGLNSLTIPSTVTSIGYEAFQYCTKLSVINYNAKNCANIDYSYDVFAKAGASTGSLTVNIGNTVERIPNNLFRSYYDEDYTRVTRIVLSNSVQKIGDSAFRNCKDLTTISWGTGLLEIGEAAFANAESLSSVSLPAKLTTIKTQAFKNSGLNSLTIPSTVTSIGYEAFQYCTKLSVINYNAKNCANIDYSYDVFAKAGASAGSLTVNIGDAVEKIPDNLFRSYYDGDYVRVTKVVFGQNIHIVGGNAFKNCSDLKQVQWSMTEPWWDKYVLIYEGNDSLFNAKNTYLTSKWHRLAGKGRYDTMQTIVKEGFSQTGGTVIIATGTGFKDALAAAGLAGLYDAPIILTEGKNLSSQAKSELTRLKPQKIYIAGGTSVVSDNVKNQIKKATNIAPVRLAGQNSSETSAKLALAGKGKWSTTAVIATNKYFKDALSVAPLAYSNNMPILLADNGQSVSTAVLKAMKDCGIKNVIIVGGTAAVTERVESQLTGAGFNITKRLWGNTGVATSAAIAKYGISNLGMSANQMGVATSQNYPDALAGAAFCGIKNSVLILADDKATANTSFPSAYKKSISKGYIFGGTGAVGEKTVNMLDNALK